MVDLALAACAALWGLSWVVVPYDVHFLLLPFWVIPVAWQPLRVWAVLGLLMSPTPVLFAWGWCCGVYDYFDGTAADWRGAGGPEFPGRLDPQLRIYEQTCGWCLSSLTESLLVCGGIHHGTRAAASALGPPDGVYLGELPSVEAAWRPLAGGPVTIVSAGDVTAGEIIAGGHRLPFVLDSLERLGLFARFVVSQPTSEEWYSLAYYSRQGLGVAAIDRESGVAFAWWPADDRPGAGPVRRMVVLGRPTPSPE